MEEFEYVDRMLWEVLDEELSVSLKWDIFKVAVEKQLHMYRTQTLKPEESFYVLSFSQQWDNLTLTNRQRTVITKVLEKDKMLNILEINDLLNTFLPQVKTNLTQEEILSLLLKALDYLQYDLESHRLPVDDSWKYMRVNGMSVLGIDLEKNQKALKEFITQ